MKHKVVTASLLAAALVTFAVGSALAQHDEHHPDNQAPQAQTQPGQPGMMGQGQGMMGMMGIMNQMMGQMTTHHEQMTGLMTKLMDSMKAIENEKDPTALKQKLAEHRTLLAARGATLLFCMAEFISEIARISRPSES